jgi:hypothetical protein
MPHGTRKRDRRRGYFIMEVPEMTPTELKSRVEETLYAEDTLDASKIRVVVQGRDVWLEGEVPSLDMYDLADHLANTVGGVGDLTNNLIVSGQPYDLFSRYDDDVRLLMADASTRTDVDANDRLDTRVGPFGEEHDEPEMDENDAMGGAAGGPVGGDNGMPWHPTELSESNSVGGDLINAEEPWRYQSDGPNAHLDPDPVLPPDEDEV